MPNIGLILSMMWRSKRSCHNWPSFEWNLSATSTPGSYWRPAVGGHSRLILICNAFLFNVATVVLFPYIGGRERRWPQNKPGVVHRYLATLWAAPAADLPEAYLADLITQSIVFHDDVIKWKHFPCYWPFVRRIHRSPVNSLYKGQWRGALMFSLVWAWRNGCVNNRDAGDLRRHRAHYDVTVMFIVDPAKLQTPLSCLIQHIPFFILSWRYDTQAHR